jgi:putative ATP-dependent endonuclease of OLD family
MRKTQGILAGRKYLQRLRIRGFRCFEDFEIEFQPGINILIGENDTGKTAVLDALRLSLGIGPQRETYLDTDLDYFKSSHGLQAREVRFDLTFDGLSEADRWIFLEMLALGENKANATLRLHVKYWLENVRGTERQRFKFWGGADESEEQSIPQEVIELFYYVHMEALRDATRFLRPARGSRLGQLFTKLEPNRDEQEKLAQRLGDTIRKEEHWNVLLRRAESKINVHLLRISLRDTPPVAQLDFVPQGYKQIAEGLKLICYLAEPISKQDVEKELRQDESFADYFEEAGRGRYRLKGDIFNEDRDPQRLMRLYELVQSLFPLYFEVGQTGLGTDNLLYAATVLGDLLERREREKDAYIALMIEEPEAHLHPQLQCNLFSYFEEVQLQDIQVFITSHSPTITAKTSLSSISVLQRYAGRRVASVLLRSIELPDKSQRLLERFLDVTKSQLFFARGVLLVEGISESLMLPTLAKSMGDQFDLGRKGIEIVNIGGVAFEHFARLFNSNESGKRLEVRAAILTDGDSQDGKLSARAINAVGLKGGLLRILVTPMTYEYDLYRLNEELIRVVLEELGQGALMPKEATVEERASAFVSKLQNHKEFTKARFAQEFAYALAGNAEMLKKLKVPEYIKQAIKWVVNNDEPEDANTGTTDESR